MALSKKTCPKQQSGYIALISVIVISAVLIIIAASVSLTGFFSRFNVTDVENKKQSSSLAEGCVDVALLRLANNPADTTTGSVPVGSDSCTVFSVQLDTPSAGKVTIQTKAIYQQSVTNLKVVADENNFSTISWEELPAL